MDHTAQKCFNGEGSSLTAFSAIMAALLLSATAIRADDLPWKMEGSIIRDAASTCASASYSDFIAHEVAQGASAALPNLVRNEWTSCADEKELRTMIEMVIILK